MIHFVLQATFNLKRWVIVSLSQWMKSINNRCPVFQEKEWCGKFNRECSCVVFKVLMLNILFKKQDIGRSCDNRVPFSSWVFSSIWELNCNVLLLRRHKRFCGKHWSCFQTVQFTTKVLHRVTVRTLCTTLSSCIPNRVSHFLKNLPLWILTM